MKFSVSFLLVICKSLQGHDDAVRSSSAGIHLSTSEDFVRQEYPLTFKILRPFPEIQIKICKTVFDYYGKAEPLSKNDLIQVTEAFLA